MTEKISAVIAAMAIFAIVTMAGCLDEEEGDGDIIVELITPMEAKVIADGVAIDHNPGMLLSNVFAKWNEGGTTDGTFNYVHFQYSYPNDYYTFIKVHVEGNKEVNAYYGPTGSDEPFSSTFEEYPIGEWNIDSDDVIEILKNNVTLSGSPSTYNGLGLSEYWIHNTTIDSVKGSYLSAHWNAADGMEYVVTLDPNTGEIKKIEDHIV